MSINFYKSYYIASIFALIISISPVISLIHPNLVSILQIILFSIILFIAFKTKLVRVSHLVGIILILGILSVQNIFVPRSSLQLQISVFRFILIPFTIFYSFLLSKYYNKSFLDTFYLYFFINLAILYYRAFFDYTFFNLVYFDISDKYADLYTIGMDLWRPSNLSSAIVFSIELVIFLVLQLFLGTKNKLFYTFAFISVIPIIIMHSRSSWLIMSSCILYYYINKRKYFILTGLISVFLFVMSYLSLDSFLIDFLTFKEVSYSSRFNSHSESLKTFLNDSVGKLFFGNGTGYSNLDLNNNGSFGVYVENFHLSVLYDQGVFILLIWFLFNLYNIYLFKRIKKKYISILLILLMITNLFSSSLTSFPVQIFYQIILLYGYSSYYNFKNKNNISYGVTA